jgi:ribosomal protein L40E
VAGLQTFARGRFSTFANIETSEKSVHFFCSSACQGKYFKLKVAALMGSGLVINASGQDISGFLAKSQQIRESSLATCWSCGRSLSVSAKECRSCGEKQELEP